MNNSVSEQKRNKITATHLLLNLEKTAVSNGNGNGNGSNKENDGDGAYYQHLKSLSTVKHIKHLISSLDIDVDDDDQSSWASTSRATPIQRNSIRDLKKRLQVVESNLHALPPPSTKLTNTLTPPTLDFLIPALPTLITPPPPSLPEPEEAVPIPEVLDEEEKGVLVEAASTFPVSAASVPPPPKAKIPSSVADSLLPSSSSDPISDRSSLLDLPSSSTLRSRPSALRSSSSSSPSPSDTPSSHLLDHHLSLQSSLLTSLTSMSSQLKANTQHFSSALEKDREVLENAEKKLEGNLSGMIDQGGRLRGYGKGQKGSTCMIIMGVGVVGVLWTGIFLLIKVT